MAISIFSRNNPNWSDMPYDVLLHILSMVNILDRITNVAEVCSSWRAAASDQMFFKTVDISECRQHLINPQNPRGGNNTPADHHHHQLLRLAFLRGIKFGGLKTTKLVLDPPFLVNNELLRFAYQRCPNLQELVLPFPNSTTNAGLKKACRFWPKLESLFVAFNSSSTTCFPAPAGSSVLSIAGVHCLNLRTLKLSCCCFNTATLQTITQLMPRLKVLIVRCGDVRTDVVEAFASMPNLEEVYVSVHKEVADDLHVPPSLPEMMEYISSIIDNARKLRRFSRLGVFHVCYWEECNSSCLAASMHGISN